MNVWLTLLVWVLGYILIMFVTGWIQAERMVTRPDNEIIAVALVWPIALVVLIAVALVWSIALVVLIAVGIITSPYWLGGFAGDLWRSQLKRGGYSNG